MLGDAQARQMLPCKALFSLKSIRQLEAILSNFIICVNHTTLIFQQFDGLKFVIGQFCANQKAHNLEKRN